MTPLSAAGLAVIYRQMMTPTGMGSLSENGDMAVQIKFPTFLHI